MADLRISQLSTESPLDGTESAEIVTGGINKKTTTQDVANLAVSRAINRAWTADLVFDKTEIMYVPKTMDDDIHYTLASGSLVDQFSCARQRIIADGTHAITFASEFNFIYGITNGEVLAAGTYQIYFLYINGNVTVQFPGISAEESGLIQLSTPANFTATADGENAIDLDWDAVTNAVGYRVDFSLNGTSGWTLLIETDDVTTATSHTDLVADTTLFYRVKAIGDHISFSDSGYATDSATTESGADVTPPTFTFDPADSETDVSVNQSITITANESLRNTDGSALTTANVASVLTLKEDNSGGVNIAFTATIDGSKTVIVITPDTVYGGAGQDVYVAINNVEDVNGNEVTVAESATFTVTDYTEFDGGTNRLVFGDILDSLFASADTNFWLELTVKDALLTGTRPLVAKWYETSNQRSFRWYAQNSDIYFAWVSNSGGGSGRYVKWTGAWIAGEHDWVLKYDGSIDTNDGLDRVTLLMDGGTVGSKSLVVTVGALGDVFNTASQLAVGALVNPGGTPDTTLFSGLAKDFIVRSTAGTVVEINVNVLSEGTDSSGNGRNGTWV